MQNKLRVRLLALACLVTLAGCSANNGGGNSSGSNNTLMSEEITETKRPLFMDELGVVPTKGSYLININNLSAKNYTLDSIKITDAKGNDQSSLLAVSGQMCERLVANGSCSLEFSPHTATAVTLLLTANLRDNKNELHQVQQIVRISDKLGSDSGISFATEFDEVVTEKGDYRVTIPVILNEDFDKVEAFNGSLLCEAGNFKKGSTCTYHISGHALSDNTLVSANISGYRNGSLVAEQTNNLDVRIAAMPFLVLSQDVSLNANGESEASIVVYNDGNKEATAITYTHTLPGGVIIPGNCATIPASSMCTIKVKAKSETHGSGRVTATYDMPSRKVGTNISYTGTTNAGAQIIGAGSLENTLINNNATTTITITNIGKNNLSDFAASLVNSGNGMQVDSGSSTCPTILIPGTSCSLIVKYFPTQAQSNAEASIVVTAKYKGEQGQINSYVTRHTISYSAINPKNVLTISSPINMSIIANESQISTQAIKIIRTYTGVLPLRLNGIDFNKSVRALSFVAAGKGGCTSTITLSNESPSCDVVLKYGTVSSSTPITESGIVVNVTYTVSGTSERLASSQFSVQAHPAAAKIELKSIESSGTPLKLTGKGTSGEPYNFVALSRGQVLKLSYTFKNTGNIAATNVNIGTGFEGIEFPYGVEVASNTCGRGIGAATIKLEPNAECKLVLNIPDEVIFNDIAHANNGLPIQNGKVQLPLSINYTDINGAHTSSEASKYISFSRNWAGVKYVTKTVTKTNNAWHVVLKAIVEPVLASYYPINISILQTANSHLDKAINVKGCTIKATDSKTCEDLSFDLPLDSYPLSGDVLVETELNGTGIDAKDKLRANHDVAYSDAKASAIVTKMWSQPKFKGIISRGRGESFSFEARFFKSPSILSYTIKPKNLSSGIKVDLQIPANAGERCDVKNMCEAIGVVTLPSNLPQTESPVPYSFSFDVDLMDQNNVVQSSIHLSEFGQYVATMFESSSLVKWQSSSSVNGYQEFISQDFKPLNPSDAGKGFLVHHDAVLLDGPLSFFSGSLNPYQYANSVLTVNAVDVNASKQNQLIKIYAAVLNDGLGQYPLGSQLTPAKRKFHINLYSTNTRPAYKLYSSAGEEHLVFQGDGQTTGLDYLPNKNVPAGRYLATFYFLLNGNPIKIDLDMTYLK